jgi:transposase InsO family protein
VEAVQGRAPNKRWQIDVAETLLDGRSLYKITLVDDHSNYRLASRLSREATGAKISRVLRKAMRKYGVPGELLSDNGAQFRGRKGGETRDVGLLCRRCGVRQVFTSPNHPQTIGKAEHAHKDDKMEFFDLVEFETVEEGQRKRWSSSTCGRTSAPTGVQRAGRLQGPMEGLSATLSVLRPSTGSTWVRPRRGSESSSLPWVRRLKRGR